MANMFNGADAFGLKQARPFLSKRTVSFETYRFFRNVREWFGPLSEPEARGFPRWFDINEPSYDRGGNIRSTHADTQGK
jgi:hypothetical protein